MGLGGRRTLTGQDGFVSVFNHVTWNIELRRAHEVRRDLLWRRHNTHTPEHTQKLTQYTPTSECECVCVCVTWYSTFSVLVSMAACCSMACVSGREEV